jgi:hypothetical protein
MGTGIHFTEVPSSKGTAMWLEEELKDLVGTLHVL